MSGLLKDKVILITGGAAGLGMAVAINAAEEGAMLSLVDINPEGLERVKAEVLKAVPNTKVLLITSDVAKEHNVEAYVKATVKEYGRIDGFYNNAGIEGRQAPLAEYDSNIFDRVIDVNVKGVFYGMKHVIKVMEAQGYGAIVNVSSVVGIRGVAKQAGYCASKHAVAGLTKIAAIDYGTKGIHVNAIAPGVIFTDMLQEACVQIGDAAGVTWEKALEDFVSVNPKKRAGMPNEVSQIVVFLLSDKAAYMSGAVIPIDGGQSSLY